MVAVMTAIRYTVPGATSSAFVPVPAAVAGGKTAYKNAVHGQPGTQGIPAPPCEVTGTVNGATVTSGYSGGTRMMPPVWFPQLYFETVLSEKPNVSVYSDNQMPVPAANPLGHAARLSRPAVFLGQAQLQQPKSLPKWANWVPSRNGGQ
jgi:hypothetical protein